MIALVDTQYLCHRAWHTTGMLKNGDMPTGVAYGVLMTIQQIKELWNPSNWVFAFDAPQSSSLRRRLYSGYKSGRLEKYAQETEEEKLQRAEFHRQVDTLREELLPMAGFRNIVSKYGYEGDDIIAAYAQDLPKSQEAVIIGADQDLWQCLRSNVCQYNPMTGKTVTAASFREEWGLQPYQWRDVKAMAGCKTDDVPGVDGVGEKTAAKWFRGELTSGKVYDRIIDSLGVYSFSLPLVTLPFGEDLEVPEIQPEQVTKRSMSELYGVLGIRRKRKGASKEAKERLKAKQRKGLF